MVSSKEGIEKMEHFTNKPALGLQDEDLERLFPDS